LEGAVYFVKWKREKNSLVDVLEQVWLEYLNALRANG
jgi:hypothetical protein